MKYIPRDSRIKSIKSMNRFFYYIKTIHDDVILNSINEKKTRSFFIKWCFHLQNLFSISSSLLNYFSIASCLYCYCTKTYNQIWHWLSFSDTINKKKAKTSFKSDKKLIYFSKLTSFWISSNLKWPWNYIWSIFHTLIKVIFFWDS